MIFKVKYDNKPIIPSQSLLSIKIFFYSRIYWFNQFSHYKDFFFFNMIFSNSKDNTDWMVNFLVIQLIFSHTIV
jgi:hypothetical protein